MLLAFVFPQSFAMGPTGRSWWKWTLNLSEVKSLQPSINPLFSEVCRPEKSRKLWIKLSVFRSASRFQAVHMKKAFAPLLWYKWCSQDNKSVFEWQRMDFFQILTSFLTITREREGEKNKQVYLVSLKSMARYKLWQFPATEIKHPSLSPHSRPGY